MIIKKLNVANYYERNKHFNDEVEGLVQDIFQHQTVGSIGYITARTASPFIKVVEFTEEDPDSSKTALRLARFDLSGLGEYENRVFKRIVLGKYRTNVLKGDMGSGKSATIDYLVDALRRPRLSTCGECEHCTPIVIRLDFNAGFPDDEIKVLLREFRKALYDELRQELRDLFKTTNLTDELRNEVICHRGSSSFYAAFDRFAQTYEDSVEWDLKTSVEKANLLFSYVDECTTKGIENISVMMRLVHLTKKKLRSDPACLILVFDNIDSILPQAQFRIFAEILAYQEIAQVQCLVALRRATFSKFEENRAAYTFGPIEHVGPDIKEVVAKRLEHYSRCWDSLPEVRALQNPKYKQSMRARLDYLVATKDDPRGALQRIAWICGSSIRQGLFMCERLFINSVVPYDELPRYKDEIVRAVLVGDQRTNEISPEDHCLTNLLLNKATGEASLLNIRVLQLIAEMENNKPNGTLSELIDILKAIGGWTRDDVRTALNYLLYMRRPLLWVDGKANYDKLEMARHPDDVLHLTEAGHTYLRDLVLDLVYVQEAALSVRWSGGHIPRTVDYTSLVERFQVLRCLLDDLATQDYKQTEEFKTWLSTRASKLSVRPILFVNRIIASVGRSALNILLQRINESGQFETSDQAKHETMEELRNWRSMIDKWLDTEMEVSRTTNKRLRNLSKEYHLKVTLTV